MTFEIAALVVLLALGWFWYESIRAREIGIGAVRAFCVREGLQLLDDTVVCRRMRPARNERGHMSVRRVFEFEYSGSGYDRYRGSVTLLGREIELLDLGAHRGNARVSILR